MAGSKNFFILLVVLGCLALAESSLAAKKQVVIIRYRIAPSHFTTVVNGFKETMARRGYIEDVNIDYIDVLTRSADKASVPDVLEAVEAWKDKADIFITCGWVSMIARPVLQEAGVPQLFVPVLESVAYQMLPSVSKEPATNLSGIYLMYPPEKILRLSRFLLPHLKRYAYVYDSRIPADQVFKQAYEELAVEQRFGIELFFLDLAQGVEQVLAELAAENIEAYGGIVGAFKQREALAASKLPVITSFTLDIEKSELESYVRDSDIVAGLFNPFRYCGEQAAEMAADIFTGKNTIERTIPRPAMQMAFINMVAAQRFQLKVPFAALEAVDMVVK